YSVRQAVLCPPAPSCSSAAGRLDLIGGSRRVAIEELHCLAGIFSEILVDEIELVEEIVRHRNDIGTDLLAMEEFQESPRVGPQRLRFGAGAENLLAGQHVRDRVH